MAYHIADLFEHAADAFPDRLAIACAEDEVTYAELERQANQLAHHLAASGVRGNSHVGMCMRNRIEAIVTMLAVYKLGAVLININFRYTAKEIAYVLDNGDIVAVVHERRDSERVEEAVAASPRVRHTVVVEDGSDLPSRSTLYPDALTSSSGERYFEPRSSDAHYLLYTGGTTGMPKGVIWRHEDIWRALGGGVDFATRQPLPDEFAQAESGRATVLPRLCLAPLIHGNAQWAALGALFAGQPVVLLREFDADEVWRTVERRQICLIILIGDAMARPMADALRAGDYDTSSVMVVSSSAALFSPAVKAQYLELLPGRRITDTIGSSETGLTGTSVVTTDATHSAGGPRVRGVADVIVIDLDNEPIPAGSPEIGRLARGGYLPLGYYKDEEKTRSLFAEVQGRRYAVPGDLARHEADGTITLLGRGNTCVNTGGEKVFPEEVESVLMAHPDVLDVLVIGVPDERMGQRVAAVIEPRPGTSPSFEELTKHVRSELAGYKVPRSIWIAGKVRRLATGKADYAWARNFAMDHQGTDLAREHADQGA